MSVLVLGAIAGFLLVGKDRQVLHKAKISLCL